MKYNIQDIIQSNPIDIDKKSAIAIMYDGSEKYQDFFVNIIKTIKHLHNVKLIVFCKEHNEQLIDKMYLVNNNLCTDIDVVHIEKLYNQYEYIQKYIHKVNFFQYIKPFVLKYILDNKDHYDVDNLLYLDIDILPMRKLDLIFNDISNDPIFIEELGLDINKYGYNIYINDHRAYSYFPEILEENKIKYPTMPVNTGVLGFKLDRPLDSSIINLWCDFTIRCISNNLGHNVVKWWDQGIFVLVLEAKGLLHKVSKNKKYNHTVYIKDNKNLDLSKVNSNLVHFIGDTKPVLSRDLYNNKLKKTIQIFVCGHNDVQNDQFHTRKYFNFVNLNKLSFDNEMYSNNTLSESRIFLTSENIFPQDKDILGVISASWYDKYNYGCVDSLYNWPITPMIDELRENQVICAGICSGAEAQPKDPLFKKNFNKHFRHVYRYTKDIQNILQDITGLAYDGISPAPYSNQIIAHRSVFNEYAKFMRKTVKDIVEAFGIDFKFFPISVKHNDTYDNRRPLGYLVEEAAMIWWSNQKHIKYISIAQPQQSWYKNKRHLGK